MSVSAATARQEIARRAAEFLQGTATGGSTTTVIDTNNLQYVDSYWNEQYILFTSGANNGRVRKVSAFTSASSQATLYSAVTAVASGDTYELYRRFSPTDYQSALNAAINKSWPSIYLPQSTAVATAIQDTLQYVFPTSATGLGAGGLIRVEYQRWTLASQSTFPYQTLSADDYDVINDYSALTSQITPTLVLSSGLGMSIGTYLYTVTFTDYRGESSGGPRVSITTTSGNTRVAVTIPPGPLGTRSRSIYRTGVGGASGSEFLVITDSTNASVTYVDTTSDAGLGAAIPTGPLVNRPILQLRFNPDTNRLIRFVYGSPISTVATDSDRVTIDPPNIEWLYAQGKAELWRIEANRSEAVARKDALQMLSSSQAEADALKKDLGLMWPPKPIRRTRFYLGGVV